VGKKTLRFLSAKSGASDEQKGFWQGRFAPAVIKRGFFCGMLLLLEIGMNNADKAFAAPVPAQQRMLLPGNLKNAEMSSENDLSGLRDPTEPPENLGVAAVSSKKSGTHKGLVLTTILVSPQRRLAIINNQITRVGDKIGSVEIMAITPQGVRVREREQRGREWVLTFDHQPIKTVSDPVSGGEHR
jgi:hypothetical protein